MSFSALEKEERIAVLVLGLLAIVFLVTGVLAEANDVITILLNLATELIGVITLYFVYRYIVGVNGSRSETIAASSDPADVETQDREDELLWKAPLIDAIRLLINNDKLNLESIGVFRDHTLPDGTELLNVDEVIQLRTELTRFKKESSK